MIRLCRIIPARAGFTRLGGVPFLLSPGSSPLARGLLVSRPAGMIPPGIIPARAGFTEIRGRVKGSGRDHPRSRGVYLARTWPASRYSGSSPLARGLHALEFGGEIIGRIIPARAGFTELRRSTFLTASDHPRSRGVYRSHGFAVVVRRGSSPLARGLPCSCATRSPSSRIIPARAGFTHRRRRKDRRSPDHPRSRGVYRDISWSNPLATGSSPLARGLLDQGGGEGVDLGIIPARAGFTLADPWNPNEPTLYQTPAAFTADLGPAPPGRDSAVEFGAALSAAGRAGRDLVAAGLRSRFGHHPDTHRRVATTSG